VFPEKSTSPIKSVTCRWCRTEFEKPTSGHTALPIRRCCCRWRLASESVIHAENVDKAVSNALNLGATGQGPVDMFWGDRCGIIVDPDGYAWMVGTHKAEPTVKEMKAKMLEQMRPQPAGAVSAA
jgi:hypothetical protein